MHEDFGKALDEIEILDGPEEEPVRATIFYNHVTNSIYEVCFRGRTTYYRKAEIKKGGASSEIIRFDGWKVTALES